MALPSLSISKNWLTGTNVQEANWDNIRTPLLTWAAGINAAMTQISRDAFGTSYVINTNGAPILSASLQTQINNILAGSSAIIGTTSNTFEINTDGFGATLTTASLTADRTFTFPDVAGTFVLVDATQTLTNKTLTSPTINSPTITSATITGATLGGAISGTYTLVAPTSITGNIITHSGADLRMYSDAGTTLKFQIDGATGDFGIASGQTFYLDGAALSGQNFIKYVSTGSGYIQFGQANTPSFGIANAGIGIKTDTALGFDGVDASATQNFIKYVSGSSKLQVAVGNSERIALTSSTAVIHTNTTINSSGEILLGDVDPPTANYANRNSFIKGWLVYNHSTATILNSYNVTSVNDDSTGIFTVTWATDFANSNYGCGGMPFLTRVLRVSNKTTGTTTFETYDSSFTLTDDSNVTVFVMGDQ